MVTFVTEEFNYQSAGIIDCNRTLFLILHLQYEYVVKSVFIFGETVVLEY